MAKHRVKFSKNEMDAIRRAGIERIPAALDDEELFELEDAVTQLLCDEGIDDNEQVNPLGRVCEGIIEKLADV